MILCDEYILRALELRLKTVPIVGSLCSVKNPRMIHSAMKYFDIWNHENVISHPFTELTYDIFDNMTPDLFKIIVEYLRIYAVKFTDQELQYLAFYGKRYGYECSVDNRVLSFRRVQFSTYKV